MNRGSLHLYLLQRTPRILREEEVVLHSECTSCKQPILVKKTVPTYASIETSPCSWRRSEWKRKCVLAETLQRKNNPGGWSAEDVTYLDRACSTRF